MRISINGRFLSQPVTGVQRYARELVAALDKEILHWTGWGAELLVPPSVAEVPAYANIPVRRVGRLHGHAWEQLELPLHARGDLLFCPSNTAPVSAVLRRRAFVTVHDLSYLYHPEAYSRAFRYFYNLLMPLILSRADMVTVSTAEFTNITRHYPHAAPRLAVVPNGGVPASVGHSIPDLETLRPYVLYVGSFTRRKNFPAVLEAARRLLADDPALRFVFVGGSPKIFTQAADIEAAAHSRMVFVGQVNDYAELEPYYRSAEALLFPSLYESSGLPPVEAMANGCPVIASDIPALVERCGDAALYCDPRDIDSICDATRRLLRDRGLRGELVARGLERSQAFTWELCARKTLESIANARGAAATAAVAAGYKLSA